MGRPMPKAESSKSEHSKPTPVKSLRSAPRVSGQPRGPRSPIRRSAFNKPAPLRPEVGSDAAPANQPPCFEPQQVPATSSPIARSFPSQAYTPQRTQPAAQPPRAQFTEPERLLPPQSAPRARSPRPRRARGLRFYARSVGVIVLFCIIAVCAWGYHLFNLGDSRITRLSALTGNPDTPGTTYLIVGSDERGGIVSDPTEGHRADTIMVLQVPESGTTSLVSIPRDSLVNYPDGTSGKINGALNFGGHQSLVQTVESLTGLTVDHYVQIGMDGVKQLTDAVGGVNLCLDYDVDDPYSTLVWQAGCHDVDGTTALAFSRMRYQDPLGDIGRTARQRQVVSKIISKAASPSTFASPSKQRELVTAAADVLTVDNTDSLFDVAWAGLALRSAMGPDGAMGTPPISSLNYVGDDGASYVLLNADAGPAFWADVRDGKVTKEALVPSF
ncbi:cell envelope-related function transcriptional attenuator common domain-containing protein [Arcanobacterium phocae]|uniref:Cell envelope-related function transcriptional attenuator common domain-containing protein n=1 Tax=Arcanobacterium phocae TaxID=131112 RepID=A0A1H2LEN0_9ACTO|nr:cell envelope-related function transcriptional attenuator common domain-containing protein [Arcanobacterium phocae]